MILFLSYVSGLFCDGWSFKLVVSVKSCSFLFLSLLFPSFLSAQHDDSTWEIVGGAKEQYIDHAKIEYAYWVLHYTDGAGGLEV